MSKKQVTIQIDEEAARAFQSASLVDKRKLEALVSIRVIEAIKTRKSLKQIMKETSKKAQKRGLTLEILETVLNEKE